MGAILIALADCLGSKALAGVFGSFSWSNRSGSLAGSTDLDSTLGGRATELAVFTGLRLIGRVLLCSDAILL